MTDDAKKFEKEKETILHSLPDSIKGMFRVMGFTRVEEEVDSGDDDDEEEKKVAATATAPPPAATEDYVPCLVLSPYDVPPRPVRDVYWHSLYMTAKRKKQLGQLDYLVYHYGSDDPDDCYSLIAHEDFKSYEKGVQEGYDKLPSHIQQKVDAGSPLTEEEEKRVRALKEMHEDAAKMPEDRKRGNCDFLERHEEQQQQHHDKDAPPTKKLKTANS